MPGMGWYVGEEHPLHKIVRWSGPLTISRLFLPVRCDYGARLEFCVVGWMSLDILDSLELYVNDQKIPLIRERDVESGGFIFKGELSKPVLGKEAGVLKLSFRVKETLRPIDLDPSVADDRKLGLCYKWLSLEPIGK
jgi:hypothetical protein